MLCIFRLVILALFIVSSNLVYAIEEGKPAPAFTANLIDGKPFSIESAKGQVVIINFWATWCPPCRQEMPAFEHYYQQHKNQGLRLIAVSLDEPDEEAKVHEVMKAYGFDVALERETLHKGYGRIWRLPLTFVIDRKGILRKDGWYGAAGIDQALLDKVVTPLLEEK
jgi:peroxiredoxin